MDAARLFETTANPAPAGAEVVWLGAGDGTRLRAAWWPAIRRPAAGTIVLATGRAECLDKYFETIGELRDRGFAVCAFDWRGQGGSQRELDNPRKGHVDDFSLYLRDLDAVADWLAARAPRPWSGLAHSMGGAIYLAAAREGRAPFERMVLSAPLIGIHGVEAKRWPRLAATTLDGLGFGATYIPGGGDTSAMTRPFAGNALTGDAGRYARNAEMAALNPQIAIGDPTIGWVAACFRQIDAFAEFDYPRRILMPTLILAAGADTVVSTPATERFAARLKAGRALILPTARHELLMERDEIRSQFWAAFDAFVGGADSAQAAASDAGPGPALRRAAS